MTAASWIAVVAVVSLAPLNVKNDLHTTGQLHFYGHFLIYAFTALIAIPLGTVPRQQVLIVFSIWCAGAALEVIQVVIYKNEFEWADVLTNTLGLCSGATFALALAARRTPVVGRSS
jgi:hypothetical protein